MEKINNEEVYFKLNFLLRRLDFDIDSVEQPIIESIYELLDKKEIDLMLLLNCINKNTINRVKVCNELGLYFIQKGKFNETASLLWLSCQFL
ncbi:hypothetical protein GMB50_09160 [Turicibacter sanguinis]|uniref:hypothetical protein n=1 Tax=Turicibacter sanguinis TaxID=154288 RepID=UPI0012BC313F|nr:hypothetical protein [Turicibacter sanguinis]MDB8566194.1 hypothetical protein [Turicibacter sanguinis]MDB8568942.1 hypothetical protein [Turicibacter sanguinis]MDB8571695.1 hypothetical protein [Turicibacter sanguinis]MDB8580451.1 hypothetical protein [Turicibacter sanguinis]MTO10149.1 hypothetical protein [Turicibacter sanguinis]